MYFARTSLSLALFFFCASGRRSFLVPSNRQHPKNPKQTHKKGFGTNSNALLEDVLAEAEGRYNAMKRVEIAVRDLDSCFRQLNTLVLSQQEHIDNIEMNVESTKDWVEQGREEIVIAKEYQTKSRKKLCTVYICCCVIFAILLILFLFVFTDFGSKMLGG